jgi:hypothetical protein
VLQFKGRDSDFTKLDQFEREYRLFHSTKKIPSYQKFRCWKAFYVWRKAVRFALLFTCVCLLICSHVAFPCVLQLKSKKKGTAAGYLSSTLFLLNPSLRTALMRLRRLCFEVAEWGLFSYDKAKTYTLEEFVSQQNIKRVQVTSWLTEFAADVRALVRGACDEVLDTFLTQNDIRADHKMTFMERAALRSECIRLTKFIRLADYLVRDTLLGLALDSTTALLSYLVPAASQLPPRVIRTDIPNAGSAAQTQSIASTVLATAGGKKKQHVSCPIFVVSVSFDPVTVIVEEKVPRKPAEDNKELSPRDANVVQSTEQEYELVQRPVVQPALSYAPSISAVKTAVKSLLYDAMVVISAPPRLLSHADLTPYTQAASDDAEEVVGGSAVGATKSDDVDLTEAVTNHSTYKKIAMDVYAGLELAFSNVEEFCKVFVPFAGTYFTNEGAADNAHEEYSENTDLKTFEQAIALYKSQLSEFDCIPTSADIGIFKIDSLALKQRVMPSPARCLLVIRELLPVLMGKLTSALIGEVRSMFNVLASNPMDVDPFVAKLEMLDKVVDALPDLRDREAHIRSIAQLMSENTWGLADDLKAQFRVSQHALRRSLCEASVRRSLYFYGADVARCSRRPGFCCPKGRSVSGRRYQKVCPPSGLGFTNHEKERVGHSREIG